MSKVTDVVSWVMKGDDIIKLEKAGKTYDISDAVAKFLESKGLFDKLEDKTVDVEIDESTASGEPGESAGTITRLNLSDGKAVEPKKEEFKKEEAKAEQPVANDHGLVVKTITVGGVSVPKESAVDKETKTWYNLDSTIDAQKFKDECTGNKVEITVLPQEKGNDVIKGYNLIKEEKKEDEPKDTGKETGKKTYKGTGNSIEAQAATKAACVVTCQMVDTLNDPAKVLSTITKIAQHNFKTIQDLKNKE